ncbi:hypothetical protein [Fontivita pretiosa]|uniref:hypothetical protein n=1 Tax=Fontivita pretiosa TaxID=2989684 RepID=UPI003D16A7C5
MSDPLTKVQSGQKLRIPAAAYNAFVDAARDLRQRQQRQDQEPQARMRETGIVLIKNASGADRARFDILGVSDALIKPTDNLDQFKNRVALVGVTPLEADHQGRFAILLEPLAANAIGLAMAAGVSPVQINVADEDNVFADVKNSDAAMLQSGSSGAATILWKERGTGVKWAVVRIGAGGAEAEPVGMYPGMVHQVVAANTGGWDWEHAHSLLP